jgi:hypothetical protein
MLNSREELTQATINLFGSFAPYIPEMVLDYTGTYVFNYRHKGFAIRELDNGQGYFFPLHIERISMITPIDRYLHDVSPDVLGMLLTLDCYSKCIHSDLQDLPESSKIYALEQIEVMKQKRNILFEYAKKTLSPEDFVMMLK